MPEFFIFLLKVNAALILFCLAYYLILRRLTFYTLNRFFLLAGIVFSSLYPFIDPALIFGGNEELVKPIASALPVIYMMAADAATVDYWLIAKVVFWIGVVFMACRMAIRFYSLYRIHQQSTPGKISEYQVRLLNGDMNTFSFWRSIYLNPELHQPKELDAVLEHEQVHVQQWHTIDILLAELTTVFYWFNPGVWYMRKAVKENVEFITDQRILQKGIDRKTYQYSMIHTVSAGQPSVLMNNFNITGIKRRIIMMNSKRSSSLQLIRYVFLLPVLLVLTSAFTLFRTEVKEIKAFRNTIKTAQEIIPTVTALINGVEDVKAPEANPSEVRKMSSNSVAKKAGSTRLSADQALATMPSNLTMLILKQTMLISGQKGEAKAGGQNLVSDVKMVRLPDFPGSDSAYKTSIPSPMISIDHTDSKKMKVVLKYVTENASSQSKYKDSLKMFSFKIPANSTKANGQMMVIPEDTKMYIDDVKVVAEQVKNIDPSEILSIQVRKAPEVSDKKGIYIYTKRPKS